MIDFLTYSSIGVCLLLAFLLAKNNPRTLSHILLILWLAVTILELIATNQIYKGVGQSYYYYKTILPTLHLGLLYAYLQVLLNKTKSSQLLVYFLPFITLLTAGLIFDQRTLVVEYQINIFILSVVGFYLFLSVRLLYSKATPQTQFLKKVLMVYIFIWVALLASNSIWIEFRMELLWISMISFTLLIWIFVTQSLRLEILSEIKFKIKYMKSGLNPNKARVLKSKLEQLLETEKPYLQSNLKIADLSAMLHVTDNDVSQVVNAEFDMSFNDFINLYRVNEFKLAVANGDKEHLTLVAIAEECGFQSKSTFNAAFKKATGMTPSEYKTNLKSDPTRSVA